MEPASTRRKVLGALAAIGFVGIRRASAATCRIAVLGDSLAAGYGLALSDAFPARLEAALRDHGFPCAVLDAGVSGDTSAGGAARIGWVLADHPSHIVVELGGNDALRALPPEQLEANLERIVAAALAERIPVLIAGMLAPTNLGPDYGHAFAAAYQRVAHRHGLAFYPFFLDGLVGRQELFQPDGIHPNAAGVTLIVERILPTIKTWLLETGVSPSG